MMDDFFENMATSGVQEVTVAGRVLRPGDRVRLRPQKGGDILDIALAGRLAIIEGIDEDDCGAAHVAVVVEDDPGRDLGVARNPAHRFFFNPSELEPVGLTWEAARRVLVAGIGNIFLGDDGFGVAVAQELGRRLLPEGVQVIDFGIRGMNLAYALGGGYHAAIIVDALPRGTAPGTLCVMEPEHPVGEPAFLDSHQMNPLAVLKLAKSLGPLPPHLLVVGCEPETLSVAGDDAGSMALSATVAAAVGPAADLVLELAARLIDHRAVATG